MTILRSFTFYTIILSTILFYKLSAQDQPSKVLYAGVEIEGLESWMKEEFEQKFNKIFEDITADQMIDDKNASVLLNVLDLFGIGMRKLKPDPISSLMSQVENIL